MLIADVPEEPDLTLGNKHGHTQRVNRRITKSLIVEPSSPIQPVKVLLIGWLSEKFQATDLKVREELAVVVIAGIVRVQEPVEISVWVNELGVGVNEGAGTGPEAGERSRVVENVHVEAVLHVVVAHETEDVVVNIAEEVNLRQGQQELMQRWHCGGHEGRSYIRLNTPVPIKFLETRMLVEETTVPTAHVSVADHPPFADTNGSEVL